MSSKTKTAPTGAFRYTVGRRAFARIGAIDGVRLTDEMEEDLREFDRKGLTVEERRRAIARKYGKFEQP